MKKRRVVNLIEIAKLAGVTKSTVSRVVRRQSGVAPETRARVEHVIKVHHYRPSVFGRGLAGARTGLIGVLGRWMGSGFTAEVIRGIDDEVKKRGGHLLCTFAPGIDEYVDFWRSFAGGRQVDGLILLAPPTDIYAHAVYDEDNPVMLCASKPLHEKKGWATVGSVTVDNRTAMARVVDHLAEGGYRRLLHLAGPPDILDSQERLESFHNTVTRYPDMTGSVVQGAWTEVLSRSIMGEYLDTHHQWPDAVVCFNDPVAFGVLDLLKAKGVAVPQQMAVVGWDDMLFSSMAGLTTVHLPMVELGWEVARLLFAQLDGDRKSRSGRRVTLDMPLVVRETSAANAV